MMKIKLLQPIAGLHNFCAKIQKTIDIAKFILLIALVARWLPAAGFFEDCRNPGSPLSMHSPAEGLLGKASNSPAASM